jgi:hypothetical protein
MHVLKDWSLHVHQVMIRLDLIVTLFLNTYLLAGWKTLRLHAVFQLQKRRSGTERDQVAAFHVEDRLCLAEASWIR